MPDDIRALVASAQQGDRAALDQLLRLHYDRIYAVCRRVTGQDGDAADAAQETMIAIVRSISRFDGRAAFSTWVHRIATNASLDELRRRKRRPIAATAAADGWSPLDDAIDDAAEGRIDAVAERDALDTALAELPEDFRVPVVLRDVGDLDYGEIAAVLGVPIGTVKSRIARGRASLALALRGRAGNREGLAERPSGEP
ncbi:MAG: putative polymerase subfamily sigma factor [Ilumatobacteraceae bacterium]|nr:putative polymerase subfamily sigma factor [Ilumatobacteraceae bacterium]